MASVQVHYAPEKCAMCGGKGVEVVKGLLGEKRIHCELCKGNGSILVAQPAQRCASCSGQGRVIKKGILGSNEYTCSVCHGSGWAHSLIPEDEK